MVKPYTYMGMWDTPEEAQESRAKWLAVCLKGQRPKKRGTGRNDKTGRFI